jgi:hypothetical protein
MNYDKYRTELVEPDHTFLGKHGVDEATVASIKEKGKAAAGFAISTADTVTQLAKIAVPVVGGVTTMVVNSGMVMRDSASVEDTHSHIKVLKEIQADVINKSVCECDHCGETVGYALSQKNKKLARKQADVAADLAIGYSPLPNVVAPSTAVAAVHSVQKRAAGTRGVERNRQAQLLHSGARGTRITDIDKSVKFVGGCPVARAVIDELTEHWQRVVFADSGPEIIAAKLKST